MAKTPRIAAVAMVSAFLMVNPVLQPTNAAASDFAPHMMDATPTGANAMLTFRAPIGGNMARSPTFTLTAGPVWQQQDGSSIRSHRFENSSVFEIGINISGDPVMKLAGVNLSRAALDGLNADSTSDHQALWLVLGGVAILGAALGIYSMFQDECGNKTYC